MLKFFFMMWNLIKSGPLDPLLEVNIFLLNKKKKKMHLIIENQCSRTKQTITIPKQIQPYNTLHDS